MTPLLLNETDNMSDGKVTGFELGLGLEDTHVLVTGGSGLIGTVVVDAFLAAGDCIATVYS